MSVNYTSPVTGSAQTGFTSPTYTLSADTAPDTNGKQWAITAIGGTQAGVTTHAASSPFTLTIVRPKVIKTTGLPDPVTGVLRSVPRNSWKQITRKAVTPLSGQQPVTMVITTTMEVPAGADTADAANIRAALALHAGALSQQSAGVGDSLVSGVF